MDDKISLSGDNFKQLYAAFDHYYPEGAVYSQDRPFSSGDFSWKTRQEFLNFISRLTQVQIENEKDYFHIKQAQAELSLMEKQSFLEQKTEQVSATLPGKSTRELQEEERKSREEALQKSTAESKAAVAAAIKKQQEIYAEQLRRVAAVEKTLKSKEVYVKKETERPPEVTQQVIETLKTQAQADPVETVNTYAEEMRSRLKDETIPDEAIQVAAVYTIANVVSDGNPAMQAAIAEYVAKNAIKIGGKDLVNPAMALSDQQKSLKELSNTLNSGAFGQQFAKAAVPEWLVSENLEPGYAGSSVGFIPPVAKTLIEKQSEVLIKTGSTIQIETRDFVQRWQDEIAKGNVQGRSFNVVVVQESLRSLPAGVAPRPQSVGFESVGAATGMGQPLRLVGSLAAGAAKQAAVKVASKAITSKITAAIGTAIGGPLGTAVGAAVGEALNWVISKINWKNVKKYSAYIIGGITTLVLLPFIGLGSAIGFGVGAGIGSMALGATAGGTTFGGLVGGVFAFVGSIFGAVIGAIAGPIIAFLIGFPIAVALILFIINSGAYVVAPGSFLGGQGVVCNTTEGNTTPAQNNQSTTAQAAVCIVSYLNQYHINPLLEGLLGSPGWKSLTGVLPGPAINALEMSAHVDGHLQCVGFVAATAGLAYGQDFGQINACSYIHNAPSGYRFISGTSGMRSGDFFVIDGSGGCSGSSPGHIGVVLSVDGALLSCADANFSAPGFARATDCRFPLSEIAGYLRR